MDSKTYVVLGMVTYFVVGSNLQYVRPHGNAGNLYIWETHQDAMAAGSSMVSSATLVAGGLRFVDPIQQITEVTPILKFGSMRVFERDKV